MNAFRRLLAYCSTWRFPRVLLLGVVLASGIELLTVGMRFGLGLESTRDTQAVGDLTFGIRIHHGYVGLLLLIAAWSCVTNSGLRNVMVVLGIGLLASDLMHHFLVLWSITGSPQFDLVYPRA